MANRPVFLVGEGIKNFIIEKNYDFKWYAGFSVSQKQKCVEELHSEFKKEFSKKDILEISSKSPKEEGVSLSAFNLMVKNSEGENICSLESLFQSCKKFENGGPYKDILMKSSLEAKRDERLKSSGNLVCFQYKGVVWPLEPKTHFYDWIYIQALHQNKELREKIVKYDAFTDIEFNPKKSINNQARAAALYVCFYKLGLINRVISDRDYYITLIKGNSEEQLKLV